MLFKVAQCGPNLQLAYNEAAYNNIPDRILWAEKMDSIVMVCYLINDGV